MLIKSLKVFFLEKFLGGLRPRTPQYDVEKKKSKVLIFSLPLDFSLPRVLVDHFPKLYRWMFSTARCLYLYPWIFFIRKTNIKWLSYISVNGSEKWLWKFFPIVFFSIFWKIDKKWQTLALIRCTWNILPKSCIYARHHLHFWKVFSDFFESVLQLVSNSGV